MLLGGEIRRSKGEESRDPKQHIRNWEVRWERSQRCVRDSKSNANASGIYTQGEDRDVRGQIANSAETKISRLYRTAVYRPVDVELSDYQTTDGLQARRNNRGGARGRDMYWRSTPRSATSGR